MTSGENIEFLNQLVNSLKEAELKLEYSYNHQSHEDFNKIKKFILEIQKRIIETLE